MKKICEQCLFCEKENDVVTITIEHELIPLTGGGNGYACYSARCSAYRDHGCSAYGISNDCNAIIAQATKRAREELTSE